MGTHRRWLLSLDIILVFVFLAQATAEFDDESPSDLEEDDLFADGVMDDEPDRNLGRLLLKLTVPPGIVLSFNVHKSIVTGNKFHIFQEGQPTNIIEGKIIPILKKHATKLPPLKRDGDTKEVPVEPKANVARPTNKPPQKPKNQDPLIGPQFICYLKICNLLTMYNNKLQ